MNAALIVPPAEVSQVEFALSPALFEASPPVEYAIDVRTAVIAPGASAGAQTGFWLGGLLSPLRIEMSYSAGQAVAVEPTTGIFGVGESASAAIVDLRDALSDHFETLVDAGDLSPGLEEQLRFLRSLLKPARA